MRTFQEDMTGEKYQKPYFGHGKFKAPVRHRSEAGYRDPQFQGKSYLEIEIGLSLVYRVLAIGLDGTVHGKKE